jgi:hypothetical protein
MSISYHRKPKRSQRERRARLEEVRAQLGDKLFAQFMIDMLVGCGPMSPVWDYPVLAEIWLKRLG